MSKEEKNMQKQEKIIKTMEAQLRLQDEMISSLEEKYTALQEGVRELTGLMDAMLSAIVLECGTDVPLGKTLELPELKVGEILERWELHMTKPEDKVALTVVEKSRAQEMEEEMG